MRVPFFCLVAVLAAGAAHAQATGPADGGTCDPACGQTDGAPAVTFCDATAPDGGVTTLTCTPDGGVPGATGCASIPTWGPDCVLGEGAPCDPGYAFGRSRCDPGVSADVDGGVQHLFCVDGTCTLAARAPGAGVAVPTQGTHTGTAPADQSPLGCFGCNGTSTSSAALFGVGLWSLRRFRRRRAR